MDNQTGNTSATQKAKRNSLFPGMDQGAGDANSYPMAAMENSQQDMAALQSCLAGLQMSDLSHKSQCNEDVWGSEEDEDSTEDNSEIDIQCSYPFGYLKRQTVYICLTCSNPEKEDWEPAGICIGCRNACHHGHEVISLETRRNFKCDCGNKKFRQSSPCIMWPDKDDRNEFNKYNDNFKGTFCTCNCKEADCVVEDPLYQCVVCEDWYHASHCSAKSEGIEKNYTDLVCGNCTFKLDFLRSYEPFDPNMVVDESAIEEMIQYTENDSGGEGETPEEAVIDESQCKLNTLIKKNPYPAGQLWTLGWRDKLCRCSKCKEMYDDLNVSFLLDKDDEVRRYFTPSEDEEEGNLKICSAVMKFEEWLFKMNSKEREELFDSSPEDVKQKMKNHFAQSEDECGFHFDDEMIEQLFQAFKEYVLDVEGGVEYLDDMDMLRLVPSKMKLDDVSVGAGQEKLCKEKRVSDNSANDSLV